MPENEKPWTPKEPEITIEYDIRDLPPWLLHQSVRRDKSEKDLLHWIPIASSKSPAESLKEFLDKFSEKLTTIGFNRLWFNGSVYYINNGLLVNPALEEPIEESSVELKRTEVAKNNLLEELNKLIFSDENLSFSITSENKTTASFQGLDDKDQFLVISITDKLLSTKEIHRIKANSYSDGDRWGSESYSYSFEIPTIVEEIKKILKENPDYSLI